MKKALFAGTVIFVVATCLVIFAQGNQGIRPSAGLWSSYIRAFNNAPQSPGPSELSRLTADGPLTVDRIEVRAEQGPFLSDNSGPCAVNPAIQVTDGTTSFTLPLNSANTVVVGSSGGSYTDSGVIAIPFPSGSAIGLFQIAGQPFNSNPACIASGANVVVHYHIK